MSPLPDLDRIARKVAPPQLYHLRREVAHLLRRDKDTFPGAQPVSFAARHLEDLKQRDYYVCEKSDGIRVLLYFTSFRDATDGREYEVHYLIDRKNDYYEVDDLGLHTPLAPDVPGADVPFDSFHRETLLDGELVVDVDRQTGRQTTRYYVFDSLLVDGRKILDRSLDKRLAYFNERVYNPYARLCRQFPDDAANFAFQLCKKAFQLCYGTTQLFNAIIPTLEHDSDGVIFTCRETPYTFGTDPNILKWKPADENTIDFRMTMAFPPMPAERAAQQAAADPLGAAWERDYDAAPDVTLHVSHGDGGYEPYAPLHLGEGEWAAMKAHATAAGDGLDGAVVECFRDAERRWRFHRFRDDKLDGNHVSVVHKVEESIEDGVSRAQLMANEPAVRAEWKRRDAARAELLKQEAARAEAKKQEAARAELEKREAAYKAPSR